VNPGNAGLVRVYFNGFRQEVPGPLPLLGAGTAFGFSRKLRQRLQTSRLNPSA
jgi:hypothetical protein